MIVYAEVLQGYAPVLGANVTAVIESNSGNTKVLQLLDNGAGNTQGFVNKSVLCALVALWAIAQAHEELI